MAHKQRFRVVLEGDEHSQATGIKIPFNVNEVFGTRARVAVRGTINGYAFRSSVFPEGNGVHYMAVNKVMREGAKAKAGDVVEITMERDDAPREIEPPADLEKALKGSPVIWAAWEKLSYTRRKEYVRGIEEAKKTETRAKRIERTVAELGGRKVK
jgi:hypothetical protein